jgi:predicted  nucleic acid-binding Zn-ribbon protein
MAYADIRRLRDLHLVDLALIEIQAHAKALDTGTAIRSNIALLEKELKEGQGARAKKLITDALALELENASLNDKIKKFDAELYSGKVVNPREVEAFQKEIKLLKAHQDANDEKLLETIDQIEPAKKLLARFESKLSELKEDLSERLKEAQAEKTRLENDYKIKVGARPGIAKAVPPMLYEKYEAIRKAKGTGMADVTKGMACGGCGTQLAERTIVALKDDKVVTCEGCRRILYYTEGLV